MNVCEKIDEILLDRGMSRRKLALKAGIPPTTFQSAMARGSNLSLGMLQKIANALDCTPAYLMGWEEDYEFRDVPPGEPDNLEVTKKWFALKQKSRLDEAYSKLNQTGQGRVVEYAEILVKSGDYKNNDPGKE
ncbi:helix-turn-helix domain-containing protein [Massiliimalia timonensis]|uniref:helix-turn-helix domain-containing protein n=1 Tax=Massiliimalia timonensis TaxID=1987501 RepID=UPI00189D2923|nr:helix-turn-helix transcriptional regulator [Massiliimalia timonensis]